jgi:hypothetical protein
MKPILLRSLFISAVVLASGRARAQTESEPSVARASVPPEPEGTAGHRVVPFATSAFGVTHGRFFNQLIGARYDYRFSSRLAFGSNLSYANLRGKSGRVHNVLPEAALDYRVPYTPGFGFSLRFAAGFLPKNGPTLRPSAGFYVAVGRSIQLELTPFEPMIWVTKEQPELSLNGSLGLVLML